MTGIITRIKLQSTTGIITSRYNELSYKTAIHDR